MNGESQTHYLGGLIENALRLGVDIEAVLLDRGFNSVDNILEMESLEVRYIMPLRGSDKLPASSRGSMREGIPYANTP